MHVILGGWYQRTTLHLSEIYDLFASAKSNLPLSPEKLQYFKSEAGLKNISRQPGYLEFVSGETSSGIKIKYYEDGLYTLETEGDDVSRVQEFLEGYFQTKFYPAISYIFSLGAPTPKVLANIKTVHPIVITENTKDLTKYKVDEEKYGQVYSRVESGDFCVYKTPDYIFVVSKHKDEKMVQNLVDLQIFFREFKDQLQKYLNIHRIIWQEISELREKKEIKGKDIKSTRAKLEDYQNTISLISNRINQMSSYAKTRQMIAKEFKLEESLLKLYQYKFDSLTDSLNYIKEIWKMTSDYVNAAIQVLAGLEERSLNNSVKSLQLITSVGVLSGVLGYITRDTLPKPTQNGMVFFGVLLVLTILLNLIISVIYTNMKYKMKFSERRSV